ncbi:MAG: hypothetical protein HY240_03220 [Actinobacteria bacterium]|nr:hypothetical protein [Actinomycetota bacterium]
MNRSAAVPLAAAGGAVALVLILTAMGPWEAPGLATAVAAAAGTACAAAAATSWVRYRSSGDPHALIVSVGLGVISLQVLVLSVAWPVARGLRPSDMGMGLQDAFLRSRSAVALGAYATLVGWVVGAGCLLLALPLRERRGRRPVRPAAVAAAGAAVAVLLDLGTILAGPAELTSKAPDGVFGSHPVGLGPFGATLAAIAVLLLAAAAVRELLANRAGPSVHPWLAVAEFLAALGVVGHFARPTLGGPAASPVQLLLLLAPAFALTGLLADQRAEASRMRRATDRAAEITGGRAEIAQMVAHEIRGPVTTIRGLAQTAERHYDRLPDQERREFFGLIEQESARLLRVADQTSTALKVDAGTLTFSARPEDLAEVVRDGVNRSDTGEHPVTLDLEPGVELPLDRARLADAVRQLVDNAATFSPPDAPIQVRARRDGASGVVEVIDQGPGIPPERREEIFGKFPGFRPPGYEQAPGTGLGLFICRAHVREHGGDVVVVEDPEGGTMLRVTLPDGEDDARGR